MPSLSAVYTVGQQIWVVDKKIPTLYSGTILTITMSQFITYTATNDTLVYDILIDQNQTILQSTEDLITATKNDGLLLLATFIDTSTCT